MKNLTDKDVVAGLFTVFTDRAIAGGMKPDRAEKIFNEFGRYIGKLPDGAYREMLDEAEELLAGWRQVKAERN